MKKPTNHLASQSERLANYQLPYQSKLRELQRLTEQVRLAWQGLLPDTLLEQLMVIAVDGTTLTLSTQNHTAANHLTYNRQLLLNTLQQQSNQFNHITQLRFRVIVLEQLTPSSPTELQCNQNVSNVTSRDLSESTKRNTAQLASLVTDDIELQQVLQKFIKDK